MDNPATWTGGAAVITGAGGGIGEGIARAAAAAGMKLVLADIAADRIEALATEFNAAGTEAIAVSTNVADAQSIDQLAVKAIERFGPVALLVNNAGIEALGHVWDIPAATWQRVIDINLMGVVNGVRAFMPGMLAAGRPAWIANLSSVGGLGIMPVQTPYIVTKHAVLAFTECLAMEVEMTGAPISVSAVLPGPIATRIFDDAPSGTDEVSVAGHRAHMQAMLRDYGMSPAEAGEVILRGIASGEFWVSTHPQITADSARARAGHLTSLRRPSLEMLGASGRAILGR